MARQERQKKTTARNIAKTFADVSTDVASPIALSDEENAVFQDIISSRERDTWSKHDLRQAAKMSKLELVAEGQWTLLMEEGMVTKNDRGTQIENPRNRVYNTMLNSVNQIASKLGLTASQRGVAGSKQAKRNDQQTNAAQVITKYDDDDLIPKANNAH